mmetsp:Transcript_29606/g.85743  ORF Transcript_29606/g.85743 Transcript_29606/m.85743 type:complete len:216 (-) Transcript_29606:1173-1820(-)
MQLCTRKEPRKAGAKYTYQTAHVYIYAYIHRARSHLSHSRSAATLYCCPLSPQSSTAPRNSIAIEDTLVIIGTVRPWDCHMDAIVGCLGPHRPVQHLTDAHTTAVHSEAPQRGDAALTAHHTTVAMQRALLLRRRRLADDPIALPHVLLDGVVDSVTDGPVTDWDAGGRVGGQVADECHHLGRPYASRSPVGRSSWKSAADTDAPCSSSPISVST